MEQDRFHPRKVPAEHVFPELIPLICRERSAPGLAERQEAAQLLDGLGLADDRSHQVLWEQCAQLGADAGRGLGPPPREHPRA